MKNWKFITGQKEEDELYNLKKDPYEQENLIDDHPDLVKEMKKIIKKHIKHEMEIRKIREKISMSKTITFPKDRVHFLCDVDVNRRYKA